MKSKTTISLLKLLILSPICVFLSGCDTLQDVKEINGSCTIVLTGGSTVVSNGSITILEKTQTVTYRDEEGKLWSLFKDDYTSYSCE